MITPTFAKAIPINAEAYILPTDGLLLRLECFPSNLDITEDERLNIWYDTSGNDHHFYQDLAKPYLDSTRTLHGYSTVRSDGYCNMTSSDFYNGSSAGEVFCISIKDSAVPARDENWIYDSGHAFQFTYYQESSHIIYWDAAITYPDCVYAEEFGINYRYSREVINPTSSIVNPSGAFDTSAEWWIYNVISNGMEFSGSFNNVVMKTWDHNNDPSWAGSAPNFSMNGLIYTQLLRSQKILPGGKIEDYGYKGNVAAIYAYNKKLTDLERLHVRQYIKNTWCLNPFNL
jgi:hypothetical protein